MIVGDIDMITEPKHDKKLDKIIIGFLPNQSESGPARRAPKTPPINANDTINSLSTVVNVSHVSWKYSWAPPMIPVSYPNKYPPIDPAIVI